MRPFGGLCVTAVWAVLTLASPSLAFDHSFTSYAEVLRQYVHDGRVDYAGLCADRAALHSFLGEASVLSFEEYQSFSRDQKLAFVINLYNASALALVCDRPRMKSVHELKGIFRDAWSIKFIRLFDRTVSLGQLLHDILRPEFRDTRVHFALVTATAGDPQLLNVPYRAEALYGQLNRQTDLYMTQRPELNRFENGVLYLSPKIKWYAVDFGDRTRLVAFARRYFPQVTDKTRIVYTTYDWSLNAAARPPQEATE